MTTAIIAFCILSVLLILGKALRVHLPILQKLYLPSSVVGGLLGLVLVSVIVRYAPSDTAGATKELADVVRQLPGFLINVIFATLFLGRSKKTKSESMAATAPRRAGRPPSRHLRRHRRFRRCARHRISIR